MKSLACLAVAGHLMWLAVDTLFADPRAFPTWSAVSFPFTFFGAIALFYGSAFVPRSARKRRAYR